MLKKIAIFAFIFLFSSFNTYSYYSKEELRVYYDTFYEKLENKYKNKDDLLEFLSRFEVKINLYKLRTKNQNNLKLLNDLASINESKINSLNNVSTSTTTITNT
jgi:cell division FtsZ-interacting protein ZapD